MQFSVLVWNRIQDFCKENALSSRFVANTNVCSTIILSKKGIRILFHLEEMESYLHVEVEFYNAAGEIICKKTISESSSKRIAHLRKEGLRSWRRKTQNHYFTKMIDEYIRIIRELICV